MNGTRRSKDRHVRFFPKRFLQLDSVLTPAEGWIYLRLLVHYVNSVDGLPDDDKLLAGLARVTVSMWKRIRQKLTDHRLCEVIDGRWVDDDQDQNRERQQIASNRAAAAANALHHGKPILRKVD